ncbi:MAG: PHP domain-containing protein [Acidobacteria bacterium]|nr:PHP domain-containing protein [Acidobacteriota bacterium]
MIPRRARARVDLHLHTTASDGRCTPRELVDRVSDAALTVMAVTDHDTTAAVADVQARARSHGIEAISGIEITAVEDGRDIHVLGYFIDPLHEALQTFLAVQRQARLTRIEAIGVRLAELGMRVDVRPLVEAATAQRGRSVGRPLVARALVEAGYVADTREAFDRWLGRGCPAFVARAGATPEVVIGVIHEAGGIASIAHPGKADLAARIPSLAAAGLDAVEVFHPDHDDSLVALYLQIARDLRLCTSGGSDFHGDPAHGRSPGSVTLPPEEWDRLRAHGHR